MSYRSILHAHAIAISASTDWSERRDTVLCNSDGTVTRFYRGAWRSDGTVSRTELDSMPRDTARRVALHLYRHAAARVATKGGAR